MRKFAPFAGGECTSRLALIARFWQFLRTCMNDHDGVKDYIQHKRVLTFCNANQFDEGGRVDLSLAPIETRNFGGL